VNGFWGGFWTVVGGVFTTVLFLFVLAMMLMPATLAMFPGVP
jgi:hypothetical protein